MPLFPVNSRPFILLRLLAALAALHWGAVTPARGEWTCRPAAHGDGWACHAEPRTAPTPPPTASREGAAAPAGAPSASHTAPATERALSATEPKEDRTALHPPPAAAPQTQPPTPETQQSPSVELEEARAGASSDAPSSDGSAWFPSLDRDLEWAQCQLRALPPKPIDSPGGHIVGEADAVELAHHNQVALFRGRAEILQPGMRVRADTLEYDRRQARVRSDHPLYIEQPSLRLVAEKGEYFPRQHRGTLDTVEYRLLEPRARGRTTKAELLDADHSRFDEVSFTTCPPGNDGFMVHAQRMEVDRTEQVARFHHARLDLLGLPVFYSPYLSIPLTDARRSGFLTPTVAFSSTNGFDLTVPYYFNLAPNYDATLMPRWVAKRGLLLGGEFRFLHPPHNGTLRAELLPNDRLYEKSGPRGAFHAQTRSNLGQGLSATLDLNWVSDRDYLRDLGRSLAVTSTSFLRNRGALEYHHRNWDFLAELRHYRTLDEYIPPRSRPYSLLPRLNADWRLVQGPGGFDYGFTGEFVHFYREESVTGQRVDLLPRIAWPLQRSWGYLTPSAELRYTTYRLQNRLPDEDDAPDRFTYTLNLDGGLFFERPAEFFERHLLITLEPRVFYTYTPYRDQDELPLFDTGLFDFTFDNLFRGNRFNGPDRVGDANQLALGLTKRVIQMDDGRELLRAAIGQIFYFEDRRVRLDAVADPVETNSSSIIAELSTRFFDGWLLRAGVQVDPHHPQRKLRQGLVQATWRGEDDRRFHASWRLREDILEQTDLAAVWPLTSRVSLIGRWYYSVMESRTVEAVAGAEYADCCWRVRAVLRRFLNGSEEIYDNSIMLELELKGLGVLGHNIDRFLDRTIYGY